MSGELIRNRYRVIGRLGAGAAGSVFEVRDLLVGGARVVLKALWPGDDERALVAALRGEFGVLAALSDPRVCRVFDFGRLPPGVSLAGAPEHERGGYFLTRELVDGVDLSEAAAGCNRDLARICELLAAAARGLEVLHRAGIRHGDFKPANAIAMAGHNVRLIDFGLSVAETTHRSAGTLAYMAPEILARRSVDRRADLYALGITLFELAVDRLPSGDRRGADVIGWHLGAGRPLLADARDDVPASLDRLCARLLACAPEDRLPSAAEAAAAFSACAHELGASPTFAPEGDAVVAPLPMPQVAALERAFDRRRRGQGGPALIEVVGDSGSGRTTVLTEVGWRIALEGAEVVRTGGAGRGRALGVIGSALAQIAALSGAQSPRVDSADRDFGLAGFAEIARWLTAASNAWPIAIVIDDIDYADAASQRLAHYLAFALPAEARVLVLASRRARGDEREPAVAGVGDVPRVLLSPLGLSAIGTMLERAAGRTDARLAARIQRHTAGNALHVAHTLRVLASRGFPASETLESFTLPARLEEVAGELLADVAAAGRATCEALAVLGRPVERSLLASMVDEIDLAGGLVVVDAAGRLEIGRPSVRQSIYVAIPESRRRDLHARAATTLIESAGLGPAEPEVMTHLTYANRQQEIRAHLASALDALRVAGDYGAALSLGRRALAASDATDPAFELRTRLTLGELGRLSGDVDQVEAALASIADTGAGGSSDERNRARVILGRASEEAGRPDRAEALLSAVIADAPGTQQGAAAARELSRLYIKRGRAADALAVADAALSLDVDEDVALHLVTARAFARGMAGEHDAGAELAESAERAYRAGDDSLRSTALNYGALLAFRAGDYQRAQDLYRGALTAAEAAGDIVRIATLRMNVASLAFHFGDYAGCLEQHTIAVSLLRAAGADTASVMARRNLGHLYLELGAYEQARAQLASARSGAVDLHLDAHVGAIEALLGIADCRTGDAARGIARIEAAKQMFEDLGDEPRLAETLLDLADACLDEGQLDRAETALSSARDLAATRAGLTRRARSLGLGAELAARRGAAELARQRLAELAEDTAQVRAQHGRHAEWSLHRHAASALRELGDHDAAEAHRATAVTLLEQLGSGLPDAHRSAFWHDPRRRGLRGASSQSSRIDPQVSTLMDGLAGDATSERLYRLLDIYRRMSSERDYERLLEMVMETAVELSGAERGFILLADDDGSLRTAAARNLSASAVRALAAADTDPSRSALDELTYSRTVAERVFHSGELVLSNEPRQDPRFEQARSVHALHIESVVCLPVRARGEIAGVLYLESRLVRVPFSDSDLKLLTAFGDQVAILITNARLLSENTRRADELGRAQAEIEVLLAERTERLAARTEELAITRRDFAAVRRRFLGDRGAFGLIGKSPAMERVFELIERVAATDVPVLVLGESGTGKELVARALHEYGPRKDQALVSVNSGALPETLLESELFGHVRGAFTGADKVRRGVFETASGGTLFLDEIGDTPPRMQASLLRALQEGVIRRVGGVQDIDIDVRVVAATNRDLEALVAAGTFREDLYYRLHVVPIVLPPLRERAEDIPLLVDHFLKAVAGQTGIARKSITKAAVRTLVGYHWPGNVRQLEHVLTNAAVMADGAELDVADFEPLLSGTGAARTSYAITDPDQRRERERSQILQALETSGWNKSKAARLLQIPRRTFYRRLQEYDIQ